MIYIGLCYLLYLLMLKYYYSVQIQPQSRIYSPLLLYSQLLTHSPLIYKERLQYLIQAPCLLGEFQVVSLALSISSH